jgi:hypothetical protein
MAPRKSTTPKKAPMPELKEEDAKPSAADSDDAEYDGDESSEDEKDEELVRRNCAELCRQINTGITCTRPTPVINHNTIALCLSSSFHSVSAGKSSIETGYCLRLEFESQLLHNLRHCLCFTIDRIQKGYSVSKHHVEQGP